MTGHSSEETNGGSAGEGIDLDDWIESHRERERRRSRHEEQPAEVSPLTLLYTGFFLGPPATMVVALWLLGRRLSARPAALIIATCGAAWCLLQGATFGLASGWQESHLQVLRTLMNFSLGLALLVGLRLFTRAPFGHDRDTWQNTAVVAVLLLAAYALVPDGILFWLGR